MTEDTDGYGRLLAALGYPDVEPAGRRLVRGVAERGLRSYGLLVDACNVVALRYVAGIGLHDVDGRLDEKNEVAVTRSSGTEKIVPAFRNSTRVIPAGDLVYGIRSSDGFEPLAWLGKRDVDAAIGQVSEQTRVALVVALGHDGLTVADTARMCEEVVDLVIRRQRAAVAVPLHRVIATR
ncbi:MAG: phenylalanine--tRNA ligase beta subunit-related protein [Pseudonocardiaceae bacterium]